MDTGKPHSFAQFSTLEPEFHADFVEFSGSYMSISQNTVAILFYGPDRQDTTTKVDELFVWDWRTGSVVYVGCPSLHPCQAVNYSHRLMFSESDEHGLPGNDPRQ